VGLALRSDPNAVLWTGLTPPLAETLAGLISNRRVFLHPAPAESYQAAQRQVKLPLAAELPAEKLPRPMWLPAVLRLIPAEGASSGRFARVSRIKLQQK
jgi:hypothetical protein